MPRQGLGDRHPRGRRVVRARRASPSSSGSTGSTTRPAARPSGLRALGRGRVRADGGRATRRSSRRSCTTITWWQNGGIEVRRRHPDRRPRRDDALRRHADLAARAHLLHGVHARRRPLHALLRDAQPVHRRRCCTLVVADNTLQLLVGWELVGLCSFVLIGHWWEERRQQPTPRSRRSSPPAPATSA